MIHCEPLLLQLKEFAPVAMCLQISGHIQKDGSTPRNHIPIGSKNLRWWKIACPLKRLEMNNSTLDRRRGVIDLVLEIRRMLEFARLRYIYLRQGCCNVRRLRVRWLRFCLQRFAACTTVSPL